jgi:Winged helix DNA-binding domain
MGTRMTWAEASARRLARNHLTDATRVDDPARIAADLLGVHAQVMSAAELSVGLRAMTLGRADVRDALWKTRTMVKTRGPRGTVHLVATDDLPMWTGALSAIPRVRSPHPEHVRMSDEQTDQVIAAIADAVTDAELTVDELTDAIVERTGPWAGVRVMEAFQDKWPRWRQAESLAANRGALCFGPDRARRTTYTSPRRWLPGFRPAPADQALADLVRRFLHAYGPATSRQFARWLGVPPGWAASVFAGQPGLDEVDFDGEPAWINAGDAGPPGDAATVRLLPYFDAYLIGCHPRAALFPGAAADRALNRGQAGNIPALLIDGPVAGVWQPQRAGRKIVITVESFAPLSLRQREDLQLQAVRTGQILDGTAMLTVGKCGVRAHA